MKTYTFILNSKSGGRHYTSSCEDLEKRFIRHNEARVPSTKYGVSWALIWHQEYDSSSEARILESKIKKHGASRFLQGQ